MNHTDKVEQLRQSLKAQKEAAPSLEASSPASEDAVSNQEASCPAQSEDLALLQAQIASLQKDLETAQAKAKSAQEDYLRAHAEMQNLTRRLQKEKQEFVRYSNEGLLKELLPVLDSLEKALETASAAGESLYQGVSLVHKQLWSVLEKFGLRVIAAQGEVFDPHCHEAVSQVAVDAQASGTVWEVYRQGYLYQERVLRAAMVSVVA